MNENQSNLRTKPRRKVILYACLCAAFALLVYFVSRPKGPTYQGKTAEEWFEAAASDVYRFSVKPQNRAVEAFKQFGDSGAEFLYS
ncbi:MAG: hypothetical protein AB1705_04160, partial [Verrucomicrobiota bacterium]